MKKRICSLLLVLLFCLVLCVSVATAEQTGAQLSYVTDSAGLLSENEKMLLEKMAESVSKKYGVGVYIVTVEDYRDFHSEGVYKATYTIYQNSRAEEPPRSARAPRAPHHRPRPRGDAALCPGKGAGKEVVLR